HHLALEGLLGAYDLRFANYYLTRSALKPSLSTTVPVSSRRFRFPFVPTSIQKASTSSLSASSRIIRAPSRATRSSAFPLTSSIVIPRSAMETDGLDLLLFLTVKGVSSFSQ